jgi:hypothetical protein
VNHVMRRRKLNLVSKAGFIFVLLSALALSASGPSGIRRKTWRDLIVGFCGERENLSPRCKGRHASGYSRKRQSTDARHRGGASRSSVECPVMGQERRGCLIQSYYAVNRKREEQDG